MSESLPFSFQSLGDSLSSDRPCHLIIDNHPEALRQVRSEVGVDAFDEIALKDDLSGHELFREGRDRLVNVDSQWGFGHVWLHYHAQEGLVVRALCDASAFGDVVDTSVTGRLAQGALSSWRQFFVAAKEHPP